MDFNADHLKRLHLAHKQASLEAKQQLKHWEGVKSDYENLAQRLDTLPDKMSYDIMVPFGPLAFSPGKLVHTNELLVHLGDSWFSEVTCKQGLKIIDHRMTAVNKHIDDLGLTITNLEKKNEFSQNLKNDGGDAMNSIEIKEEVPNEYLHPSRRKRISRVKQASPVQKKVVENTRKQSTLMEEKKKSVDDCFHDKALLSRLDELEKLEEEEHRILLEKEPEVELNPDEPATSGVKRVSWGSKVIKGRTAESDDSDDDDVINTTTIRFQHSKIPSQSSNTSEESCNITSPADIGKTARKPKSILKPSTKHNLETDGPEFRTEKHNLKTVKHEVVHHDKLETPISDVVQEHVNNNLPAANLATKTTGFQI
uniref:Unconventional prefoldin RPB5 interactor n=1 Tax=Ciona savignyi TaxID=51511 RepID=H2YY59_CIOSA